MSVEININNDVVEINEVNEVVQIVVTGGIGPAGPTGQGVPTGGTTGQALVKLSNANFDTIFSTIGTVSSVGALTLGTTGTDLSSTVANGTTTPVITLQVPTASATNRGVLSSADFTTFNNKQSTISLTTTGTSGAATFSANTLNIPQYSGTNIYNASGSLTSARTLTHAGFNLSLVGSLHTNVFSTTGRVLLGNPTESTFLLDVNGTARVSGDVSIGGSVTAIAGYRVLDINGTTGGALTFSNNGTKRASIFNTSTELTISTENSLLALRLNGSYIDFSTDNLLTSSMRLSAGNLLLGTTTTSTAKMDVVTSGETRLGIRSSATGASFNAGILFGTASVSKWTIASFGTNADFVFFNHVTATNSLFISGATNNVIINSTTDIASAIFNVTSTTKGFLPPRMTTTQINAIATPADGLMAYNTTLSHLCVYQAGAWAKLSHSPM